MLEVIRTTAQYAISDKKIFAEKVRSAASIQKLEAAKDLKRQINRNKKRCSELDVLIKRLYESYAMGKINEKRFETLLAEYETEQQNLEETIKEQEKELTEFNKDTDKVEQFIELAEKYTDFRELTTPMINEFVDKIVVHAPDKSSGERVQEVEIYLKYIGKFDVPIPEPTAEELARQEKARIRRQKNRKAVDKYQKRIKAQRLAHKQELEKQKENASA